MNYPEHDKLLLLSEKLNELEEFVQWIEENFEVHWGTRWKRGAKEESLVTRHEVVCEYLEIDRTALQREQKEMMASLRERAKEQNLIKRPVKE